MKFTSLVSASVLLATAATASGPLGGASGVDHAAVHARAHHHHQLLDERRYAGIDSVDEAALGRRGVESRIVQRNALHARGGSGGTKKKCKAKTAHKAAQKPAHKAAQSSQGKNHTDAKHPHHDAKKDPSHEQAQHHDKSSDKKASHDQKSKSESQSSSSSTSTFGGKGLFGMSFAGSCNTPKADDTHPNGKNEFLACGISKSNPSAKWNPPNVKLSDLKMISSSEAAKKDVFKPCAPYKWAFDQAAEKYRIPAVLIMSFALQESTCQPSLNGNNGEVGMMQITSDKCEGRGREACKDVGFNVGRGAAYVREMLDQHNGNALAAFGAYNGWTPEQMTYSSATSRKYGCFAQNNLDYLNQLLNGFCQGKDGYSSEFKVFGNLAACG
ncbi:unnamed protein product [Parajaminaea phylloscopi]